MSDVQVIADVAGPFKVAATHHGHLPFSLELNTISSHTSYLLISIQLLPSPLWLWWLRVVQSEFGSWLAKGLTSSSQNSVCGRLKDLRVPLNTCLGRIRCARGPTPPKIHRSRVQRLFALSACNPSAESGLALTYYFTPSSVYVEDDLDRVGKAWSDMTRELDRSHGYQDSQMTLLLSDGSIGPDPRLSEPALP
ncbi:hypothetical protein CRG98_011119 [Punica granatum]|uniref:Uncharacterized protein n=1 Tax=Punica granatum TaxID=22663 RepID=A0A2I0KJ24_PUNGR|nr:hypothetical protein CRG98_011119 [Punica granatum]